MQLGPVVNIAFGIIVYFILGTIVNSSISSGWIVTKRYLVAFIQGLGSLFTGASQAEVVGPVGISSLIVSTSYIMEFVYLLSVISLSLGVTNLLPIPGLDGGKILLLIIEAIRRKKMSQITEAAITSLGLLLLLAIAIVVTTKDISSLL